MKMIKMNIYKECRHVIGRIRDHKYYRTYSEFRDYTMVSAETYVANLKISRRAALIPGVIVECGTWKGGMIAGIAKILGKQRDYFLYDSFAGLPVVEPIDGIAAQQWQKNTDGPYYHNNCTASENEAIAAMAIAGVSKPQIVKGWFEETLPKVSFPSGIALLRMDADWYKSTYQVLSYLFPLVNEGGLILIDDYYTWDGCSKAVHDYLSEHKRSERICVYKGVCYLQKTANKVGSF